MTSPINSRGFHIPPEVLYCGKIAPALRDTWAQLRGLADERGILCFAGGAAQAAQITSKSERTIYGHLAALRDLKALKFSTQAGELIVTFEDKVFLDNLCKIFLSPSLNKLINSNDLSSKDKESASSQNFSKERDPLLQHLAVKAYRNVMRLTANDLQRKAIVDAVGNNVQAWQEALEHWRGHGWSPTNVTGMVDSYKRGGKGACNMCNHNGHKKLKAAAPPRENDFRSYTSGAYAEYLNPDGEEDE